MEPEEIVTSVCKVWVGEDGIARVIHVPSAELTLETAKETMAAYLKLNKGKRLPLVVDTRGMKSMTRECRIYYASEETAKTGSAVAIIVDTPVSRVLGNFYLGLSKPHLPSRLFTSEQEALEWLKGFLK
jgi:hypothetical protein